MSRSGQQWMRAPGFRVEENKRFGFCWLKMAGGCFGMSTEFEKDLFLVFCLYGCHYSGALSTKSGKRS